MAHAALPVAAVLAAASGLPASAMVFADVPAHHWAAGAVSVVAVDHGYMAGYPDHRFRGQAPMTRGQLARALDHLIDEVEQLSETSWAPRQPAVVRGLPSDVMLRLSVMRAAGRYGLFEDMPGTDRERFDADAPITRYELAWTLARLLRLGEARQAVFPIALATRAFTFTDVRPGDWSGQAEPIVRDVADRYRVMIGFAGQRFRGQERLTRYQFAAAAAHAFLQVRARVEEAAAYRRSRTPAPSALPSPEAVGACPYRPQPSPEAAGSCPYRPLPSPEAAGSCPYRPLPGSRPRGSAAPMFLEGAIAQLGVHAAANAAMGVGAYGRHVRYAGRWFGLLDAQLGVPTHPSETQHAGTLGLGVALDAGPHAYVQPFVGARGFTTGLHHLLGAGGGAIASARPPGPWGFYALGQAHWPLWAGNGITSQGVLPQLAAGVTCALSPGLAWSAELGGGLWPKQLAPTGFPQGTVASAMLGTSLVFGF